MGYQGGQRTFLPGAPALGVGGIRCTARCAFCTSANVVWAPDKLPWFGGRERAPGQSTDWYYAAKGVLHPEAVLQLARERAALALVFSENEPLLSFEYTLDVARLAKAEGLRVVIYSNGFSEPAVVRKLAPHVDAVDLGIKGSLDADFYARLMRAPGATEAVKRSLLEWRAAGVHLLVSDLIATHIQQPDEAIAEAAPRLYEWIAANLGEHTPVLHGHMHPPTGSPSAHRFLLPPGGGHPARYAERYTWVHGEAKAAGLHYAHRANAEERITCHACGGLLLQLRPPALPDGHTCPREAGDPAALCAIFSTYCDCWDHEQHVTDGRCDWCGAGVPIVTLAPEELAAARWRVTEAAAAAAD